MATPLGGFSVTNRTISAILKHSICLGTIGAQAARSAIAVPTLGPELSGLQPKSLRNFSLYTRVGAVLGASQGALV
ncbi:hypothetical protein NS376_16215 [Pseudomonas oryzihabitans]|nr:hypothetical protein NS376_16215 [Pseudomonas psychrotolerans]